MRVLHVHTRYRQPGGEDAVVEAERRLLTAGGHHLETVDLHNPTTPIHSAIALAASPWNLAAARAIRREAKTTGVEVVHIHNTWFALSPAVIRGLADDGLRVVMTFHNYRPACVNAILFRDGRPCELCVGRHIAWPGVVHRCYQDSVVASAAVAITSAVHRSAATWDRLTTAIALTSFAREILIRAGIPDSKIIIKPNFAPDPGPRHQAPSRSTHYLFVGRLSTEKGVARLVEYWPEAGPPGATLLIVGDGPQAVDLRARAIPGVTLVGRMPSSAVLELMLKSRALLVPSEWYEGQPMVILEAVAAGLPVVHSNLGALGETVGPGGIAAGLSLEGWKDALAATADPAEVDRLGVLARTHYESLFTETIGLTGLEAAYGRT